MNRKSAGTYLLSLAVPAAFVAVILLVFRFAYDVNDDPTMVGILSGSYTGTPDGHAIYIHYPLSWMISMLYRILPGPRWYVITMMVICVLALAFLLSRLLDRFPKYSFAVSALFFGTLCLLWIQPVVRFTFSTCGALVTACTALSYALIPREEELKPAKLIPVLVLLCLTYCIRDYFALVALMFLGIVWLFKHYDRMFREWRCWLVPLTGALALGLCLGCDALAYSSPDWQAFLNYDDERSYLMDYVGVPDYEDYPEIYDSFGYGAREVYCIQKHTYGLLEGYSPEVIHQLYTAVRADEAAKPSPSLLRTVKSTVKNTVKTYLPGADTKISPLIAASILGPVLLVLAAVILSVRDRRHFWVFPLLTLFGLGCLWLYICYNGRTPMRVMLSLRLFCVAASLIGFVMLYELHSKAAEAAPADRGGKAQTTSNALPVILICVAALAVFGGFLWARDHVGREIQEGPAPYHAYAQAHPENIYVWLPSGDWTKLEGHQTNAIPSGSWLYFSPLYWEKTARLGLEDGMNRSVLLRPNVYLIILEDRDVRKRLGVPKDYPLEYEIVDRLDGGFVVYQFTSIG